METVKELVEKHKHQIKGGNIIDLGWENGWGKDTIDLHRELFKRMDKDTYFRSGKPSWQRFTFDVTENGITYHIQYSLDSGD